MFLCLNVTYGLGLGRGGIFDVSPRNLLVSEILAIHLDNGREIRLG